MTIKGYYYYYFILSLFLSVPVQAGVITGAIIGVVLGVLILVVAIYYLMRFLVARRVFSLSMRSVWEHLLPQARPDPLPGLDTHTPIHTHTLTTTQPRSPPVTHSHKNTRHEQGINRTPNRTGEYSVTYSCIARLNTQLFYQEVHIFKQPTSACPL